MGSKTQEVLPEQTSTLAFPKMSVTMIRVSGHLARGSTQVLARTSNFATSPTEALTSTKETATSSTVLSERGSLASSAAPAQCTWHSCTWHSALPKDKETAERRVKEELERVESRHNHQEQKIKPTGGYAWA